MAETNPKDACNRLPFASDENCDRGSVDIHMFGGIPYCKPVEPTLPAIPPEIVDTPAQVYVPPACTCFSLSYGVNLRYSGDRTFRGGGTTTAAGSDCCEGKYVSNLDLQIPCPVTGVGSTVHVTVKQGNAKATAKGVVMYANPEACTVSGNSPTLNLNLPCSVQVAGAEIHMRMEWGGASAADKKYMPNQSDTCEIRPLSPTFNLGLPCPVSGSPKVGASIRYGNGANQGSVTVYEPNGKCAINPVGGSIDLNLPCPVKGSGASRICIAAKIANEAPVVRCGQFMAQDPAGCAIRAYSPEIDLDLPCPIEAPKKKGKMVFSVELKKPTANGNPPPSSQSESSILIYSKESCTIEMRQVKFKLKVPCPLIKPTDGNPKIRYVARFSKNTETQSASTMRINNDCTLTTLSPNLNIKVPCPVSKEYLTIKRMPPRVKYGNQTDYDIEISSYDTGECGRGFRFRLVKTVPSPKPSGGGTDPNFAAVYGMGWRIENGYFKLIMYKRRVQTLEEESASLIIGQVYDTDVVSNVKYEDTVLNQYKVEDVTVFKLGADATNGTKHQVFATTPLSQE